MAEYAYLVVEPHEYRIEIPAKRAAQRSAGDGAPARNRSFSARLEDALNAAARDAGYSSHTVLMRSVRTLQRATPARVDHVESLIRAGLIQQADADRLRLLRSVPDPAWAVISHIDPSSGDEQPIPAPSEVGQARSSRKPTHRVVPSWRLLLRDGRGEREIPLKPDRHPAHKLPLDPIAEALTSLAAEGWSLAHTSEDRRVDDHASESTVSRMRFLLTR